MTFLFFLNRVKLIRDFQKCVCRVDLLVLYWPCVRKITNLSCDGVQLIYKIYGEGVQYAMRGLS